MKKKPIKPTGIYLPKTFRVDTGLASALRDRSFWENRTIKTIVNDAIIAYLRKPIKRG